MAFPTETVYGLGANALNPQAVAAIFAAKGRPADNPLIVHVGDLVGLEQVAYQNPLAEKLAAAFWPGPLTLVLPKKPLIPHIVSAGLPTVAVRIPGNPIALGLIQAAGLPLAAPSANTSARPSPTTALHVAEDLNGKIDLILDGGPADIGLESTVLDLSQSRPRILRPGGISREDLLPYLNEVEYASGQSDRPSSPGMKYLHYAPKGQVILGESRELADLWQQAQPLPTLVLGWGESLANLPPEARICPLGNRGDLDAYARNLFAAFRQADRDNIQRLIVEKVEEKGLGVAIMNRLHKSAGRDGLKPQNRK